MGWIGLGWDGLDICVGLLYEHRFAVLIIVLLLMIMMMMMIMVMVMLMMIA